MLPPGKAPWILYSFWDSKKRKNRTFSSGFPAPPPAARYAFRRDRTPRRMQSATAEGGA